MQGSPEPLQPGVASHPALLQHQREQLLRQEVERQCRSPKRFDEPVLPGTQEPGRQEELVLVRGEEQRVRRRTHPSAGPPEPLEEPSDRPGASTWMTRSRSPTSIPSSNVEVATMTQSRASANAASAA
jgi:hypothetical protein